MYEYRGKWRVHLLTVRRAVVTIKGSSLPEHLKINILNRGAHAVSYCISDEDIRGDQIHIHTVGCHLRPTQEQGVQALFRRLFALKISVQVAAKDTPLYGTVHLIRRKMELFGLLLAAALLIGAEGAILGTIVRPIQSFFSSSSNNQEHMVTALAARFFPVGGLVVVDSVRNTGEACKQCTNQGKSSQRGL